MRREIESLQAMRDHPHAPTFAAMIRAARAAVDPAAAVQRQLGWLTADTLRVGEVLQSFGPGGRLHLVAVGKAAGPMLEGALQALGGVEHPRTGTLLSVGPERFEPPVATTARHLRGDHPIPGADSFAAGAALEALADSCEAGDLLLVLLSGGASAMAASPRPPTTESDLIHATELLLDAPIDIRLTNEVRGCLDQLKFGGLAEAAAPARCAALILSDVPSDDLDYVGGGPTRHHAVDGAALAHELRSLGLWSELPPTCRKAIEVGREAHPPDRRPFDLLVANNASARKAALRVAGTKGWHAIDLGATLGGESQAAAGRLVDELGRAELDALAPRPRACALGGETTVARRGDGRGGRNLHFALASVEGVAGMQGTSLLVYATDGDDGNSGAAGTVVTSETSARAAALGLVAEDYLARDDAASYFDALGDLWVTGRSGTNVCDLVLLLQS